MPRIRGLEVPFYSGLHRFDEAAFLRSINPRWDFVVTSIPGTMDQIAANPRFGLASTDDNSRQQAVAEARKLRDAVVRLNQWAGRRAVIAVQLHSAPRQRGATDSSLDSLRRSLDECAGWSWDGAAIALEHCDAFVDSEQGEKKFLTLEAELDAVRGTDATNNPVGITINWGRSAIEARSARGPVDHIAAVRRARRLTGLIFSGCTVDDPLHGTFKDTHAPFTSADMPLGAAGSLLTVEAAADALRAAGSLRYLGLKMQPFPTTLTVNERIDFIRQAIDVLSRAEASAKEPAVIHGT